MDRENEEDRPSIASRKFEDVTELEHFEKLEIFEDVSEYGHIVAYI